MVNEVQNTKMKTRINVMVVAVMTANRDGFIRTIDESSESDRSITDLASSTDFITRGFVSAGSLDEKSTAVASLLRVDGIAFST